MNKPKVAIIVGSDSDLPVVGETVKVLNGFDVEVSVNIASAHRTPLKVKEIIRKAQAEGVEVFIAAAGMAAALPGVVASETTLPVIGIPLEGKTLGGLDAMFSILQMPPGIPVATVSIGKAGATNAAILAIEILSIKYPDLREKLAENRMKTVSSIESKDTKLQKLGIQKYIEQSNK